MSGGKRFSGPTTEQFANISITTDDVRTRKKTYSYKQEAQLLQILHNTLSREISIRGRLNSTEE